MAYNHISNRVKLVISNISEQLYRYISNLGAKDKFYKALRVADTKTGYHFMQRSLATYLHNFITEFQRLKYNFKNLITAYFDGYLQFSTCKIWFLEPDH